MFINMLIYNNIKRKYIMKEIIENKIGRARGRPPGRVIEQFYKLIELIDWPCSGEASRESKESISSIN